MAGLMPFQAGVSPSTTVLSLMLPFVIAGIGIGLAIAPTTSAVMATAPPDRVGNASGVLSTVRQLGSVMGIAVLGAVLQNRITHNVVDGVTAIQGIPEQVKQQIIAGVKSGGMQMPGGGQDGGMAQMFESVFKSWFTDAINTTFLVAVAVCLVGAVAALFVVSHVEPAPGEPLH